MQVLEPKTETTTTDAGQVPAPRNATRQDALLSAESEVERECINFAWDIEDYRAGVGMPFTKLRQRFARCPSDKPFKKILRADFSEVSVENMRVSLRGVAALIAAEKERRARVDLYNDVRPAMETQVAVGQMLQEMGNDRYISITGSAGCGKTSSLQLIADKYPGQAFLIEAKESWSSFEMAMRELATGIGCKPAKAPRSGGVWLHEIVAFINEGRILILIDEAHHMTGKSLNAIKTIINGTGARIVTAGIGTLWAKLTDRAFEEVEQLRLNRMFCAVNLRAPDAADIETIVTRRTGRKIEPAACREIEKNAATFGAFKFVKRVCDQIERDTAGDDEAAGITISGDEAAEACLAIVRDIKGR